MDTNLKLRYEHIKKEYSYINLTKRENTILMLVKNKEKDILWRYLYEEVRPLLDSFKPKDGEIVREYFRQIYKTVLGDTRSLKNRGFKYVGEVTRR